MFRKIKYYLPAMTLIFVCLSGISWAQQDAAPVPEKTESKVKSDTARFNRDLAEKERGDRIDRLNQQLKALVSQKRELQDQQKALRQKIYDACEMSPENVASILLNIEKELWALKVDRAVKEAGVRELAYQISEVSAAAKKNIEDDQVMRNLKIIVDARREALQDLSKLHGEGTVSTGEIRKAQTEFSEAMIRLELRKEELAKGRGNAGLDKLNQLMQENSLALSQDQVRYAILHEQSSNIHNIRDLLDPYSEITESKLPRINRMIDRVSEQLEQLGIIALP